MNLSRIFALALALSSLAVGNGAQAADVPALVNPSFQQRDAGGEMPSGWKTFGDGYAVHTECTPACAVRIHSPDPAAKQFALVQEVAAGAAAGHRLILSGRIRTDEAKGGAGLFIGVANENASLGEHTEGPAAPNGTTGWKRFELAVPVPANASKLLIGFGMNGPGGAWFDGIELKVDASVTVAAVAPPPPPVSPPRPVPSPTLHGDAALRLDETAMPAIAPAWRADVRARIHPIRSLFSDDFSDLQFLKPLLAGKRVVQLGESSHGVAEMNWMKVRLIKFLHQELGFDVIAFESSMSDCDLADRMVGSAPASQVQMRCLMWQWHTPEVLPLFDYVAAARHSASPLIVAGFDTQLAWPTGAASGDALRPLLPPALAEQLAGYDAQLGNDKHLTADAASRLQAYYQQALDALADRSGPEIAFQRQALASRQTYVRQLASGDYAAGNLLRDAGMASNLNFLLDQRYRGHKVIVWAHNGHVAYGHNYLPSPNMGALLAARRKAEIYTVGLYMGRGVQANNSGQPGAVPPPEGDSLDGVLANGGLRYGFVDFSQAKPSAATSWMFEPITLREFGVNKIRVTPAASYDGVLYIDTVTAAQH